MLLELFTKGLLSVVHGIGGLLLERKESIAQVLVVGRSVGCLLLNFPLPIEFFIEYLVSSLLVYGVDCWNERELFYRWPEVFRNLFPGELGWE